MIAPAEFTNRESTQRGKRIISWRLASACSVRFVRPNRLINEMYLAAVVVVLGEPGTRNYVWSFWGKLLLCDQPFDFLS